MFLKKFIIPIVIIVVIVLAAIGFNLRKEETNLKKVKVAEVTHSIFYAPQYVAHSLGYFEDEGLDVELVLTPGVIQLK